MRYGEPPWESLRTGDKDKRPTIPAWFQDELRCIFLRAWVTCIAVASQCHISSKSNSVFRWCWSSMAEDTPSPLFRHLVYMHVNALRCRDSTPHHRTRLPMSRRTRNGGLYPEERGSRAPYQKLRSLSTVGCQADDEFVEIDDHAR